MYRHWVLLALVCGANQLSGQAYFTAGGMRMGTDLGITVQQRVLPSWTVEGILSSNIEQRYSRGTLLVEKHNALLGRRLNFYVGGGVHRSWLTDQKGSDIVLRGATGIAGAELTLGRVNLSWDYKPSYHTNVSSRPFSSETAVSLRYVFVKKIQPERSKLNKLIKPTEREKLKRQKQKEKKKQKRQKAKQKSKSKKQQSAKAKGKLPAGAKQQKKGSTKAK